MLRIFYKILSLTIGALFLIGIGANRYFFAVMILLGFISFFIDDSKCADNAYAENFFISWFFYLKNAKQNALLLENVSRHYGQMSRSEHQCKECKARNDNPGYMSMELKLAERQEMIDEIWKSLPKGKFWK